MTNNRGLLSGHQVCHLPETKGLQIYVRLHDGSEKGPLPVERLALFARDDLLPWRVPKSYKHQSHKPGYYWHSQLQDLILCESRLELTTLKRIDFEDRVQGILPQPLRLTFVVAGQERSHIPDFLVWQETGCRLVNVKPRAYQGLEKNLLAFQACDMLMRRLGWTHEVYGEPRSEYRQNLSWLAGFRRTPYQFQRLSERLQSRLSVGKIEFEDWVSELDDDVLVRPAAFHMLWKRDALFDMNRVLNTKTIINKAANG